MVTGPPGTGKTTLIQSVVASSWVSAALSGAKKPPVILACAATNQAVTNIIESFGKAETKPGPLEGRWLPEISSYGTFCCSSYRKDDIENFQTEVTHGPGFSSEKETLSYIARAEKEFLLRFAEYSGSRANVRKAIRVLRSDLKKEISSAKRILFPVSEGSILQKALSLLMLSSPLNDEQIQKSLDRLDKGSRHTAFQLSTHYWEARWLLEASAALSKRGLDEKDSRLETSKDDWARRAMLTPAFVSTFGMAPRFFAYDHSDRSTTVDLLIIDEAGQAAPENGMICFSLCDKALVVGDSMQLEPVWNVPEHIDHLSLRRFGLLKGKGAGNLKEIRKSGIQCSSGSVMQRAIASCKWESHSKIGSSHVGTFLSEHRRCVPPLVAFCNEIAYRGRLQPKRSGLKDRVLPCYAWGFISGMAERSGTSWMNEDEAVSIRDWLVRREESLTKFYDGRSLNETLAVITPFAAQKRELEKVLRPNWPDMTIGTVNSLQGAEREVIVFSPTYDSSYDRPYFFDRSIHMLNVAVSRAKDSFVVIGDTRIFAPGSKPSGVLSKYLLAREVHELKDIPPIERKTLQKQKIKRVATLEDHRSTLRACLREAEERVFIASAQISIWALDADQLLPLFLETIARGVELRIFTDNALDIDDNTGNLKEPAQKGHDLLNENGVELIICERVHNKGIIVDSTTLIEGSFNWLSAVRTAGSIHQRYEASLMYSGYGDDIEEAIEEFILDLEQRAERHQASLT